MAEKKEESKEEPIIVKKIIKKGGHAAAHGGAWKVAYADFVTAMMCLFLLLWLINVDPSSKSAIVSLFKEPSTTGPLAGNAFVFGGASKPTDPGKFEGGASFLQFQKLIITKENKEEIRKALQKELQKELELNSDEELLERIEFNLVEEGILIEIKDTTKNEVFKSGSSMLTEFARNIIDKLAPLLKKHVSPVIVAGHTDGRSFSFGNYDNWNLSTDRAIMVKSRLTYGGVDKSRFARVEGYADSQLKEPDVPLSPANRRITLLLLQDGELQKLKPKYINYDDDLGKEVKDERKKESEMKRKDGFDVQKYNSSSAGKSEKLPTLDELRRKKAREAFRKRNPNPAPANADHGGGHGSAPAEPAAKEASSGGHGGGHGGGH